MTKLEMVQVALKVTGSSSSEDVAEFVERKFGVTVEARFIPLYKASLLGRKLVTRCQPMSSATQPLPQLA